ncbi:DUF2577 domain-containing protein [Paenibacillus sp. 2RAB27]|uniref:DUF2577 domain-containing protein n=1 Tax=Paenibacillus sp. 2RAB27 TaxID=3232991 RepID=UPI003F9E7898
MSKDIAALANLIKRAGKGAVDAGAPVAILFGSVTQKNPLEVTVDQRFTLDEDFLIVPESLTEYRIQLSHSHSYNGGITGSSLTEEIIIRRGLEVEDAVILFRMQGGNQYLIFDRVV